MILIIRRVRNFAAIVRKEPWQEKGNVIRQMLHGKNSGCYLQVGGNATYTLEHAIKLCNTTKEGSYMVTGDRFSYTKFTGNKRMFHNNGNKLVRYPIKKFFKSNIYYVMAGYRTLSMMLVKNIHVISKKLNIETEKTMRVLYKNFLIKEIPIEYHNRKENCIS